MPPSLNNSNLVDISVIPSYFSRFPVRVHKDAAAIDAATMDAIEGSANRVSKEYKQALYRCKNPFGNVFALVYSEGDTEKVECVTKLIECLSVHDDATEELTFEVAQAEHETLLRSLYVESDWNNDSDTGTASGRKKAYLRKQMIRMLFLDPVMTPWLLNEVKHYLMRYDSSNKNFGTLEEYLPYRMLNVGSRLCIRTCQWAIGISLSDEELWTLRELETAYERLIALTNDYFSWEREKVQSTDRVRNAVHVLMRQYALGEKQAKLLLKGIIIEEEEKTKILRRKLSGENKLSEDMVKHIDASEFFIAGSIYWSATCPRYNAPEGELN